MNGALKGNMCKKFNVIGCEIAALTMKGMVNVILKRIQSDKGGYVCFANVHVSVMAREDAGFRQIINKAFLSVPDGKPLSWVGKLGGVDQVEQIPGPDFFPQLLQAQVSPPLRHYFYGGRQEVLDKLISEIKVKYPQVVIAGAYSPPFRELSDVEIEAELACISESKADVVWVGLGAPKQEKWMSHHWHSLRPALLFGVGAAFDFHAGTVQRAPEWVQKLGFEWLHRLLSEPSRLWRRYFYTNSMFLLYLLKGVFKSSKK